jgi:hypothetical protein
MRALEIAGGALQRGQRPTPYSIAGVSERGSCPQVVAEVGDIADRAPHGVMRGAMSGGSVSGDALELRAELRRCGIADEFLFDNAELRLGRSKFMPYDIAAVSEPDRKQGEQDEGRPGNLQERQPDLLPPRSFVGRLFAV